MTKRNLLIIHFLLPFILFGQMKYEINSRLPDCELNLFYESLDTISFVTQCQCYYLDLDTSISKTQLIYYCDSLTIRKSVTFKNGKEHSSYLEFYENGNIKTKANYQDGMLDGDYLSYFEDGKIKNTGVYNRGKFIGSKYQYWDSGQIAEIRTMTEDSPLLGYVLYLNKSGREVTEEEFYKLWR